MQVIHLDNSQKRLYTGEEFCSACFQEAGWKEAVLNLSLNFLYIYTWKSGHHNLLLQSILNLTVSRIKDTIHASLLQPFPFSKWMLLVKKLTPFWSIWCPESEIPEAQANPSKCLHCSNSCFQPPEKIAVFQNKDTERSCESRLGKCCTGCYHTINHAFSNDSDTWLCQHRFSELLTASFHLSKINCPQMASWEGHLGESKVWKLEKCYDTMILHMETFGLRGTQQAGT